MKKLFKSFLKWAAKVYVKKHDPYVIGVTWSVGKSSCRDTIAYVIQRHCPDIRISSSTKNFNTDIWLVLSLFEIDDFVPTIFSVCKVSVLIVIRLFWSKRYDVIVLEYGIDHPWDMKYLVSLVQPHMAIFTWLSSVHAAYFASLDDILKEKMTLLQSAKEIVFVPDSAIYTRPFTKELFVDVLSYDLHESDTWDIGFDSYVMKQREDCFVWAAFFLRQESDQLTQVSTNIVGQEHAWYVSLWYEIAMIIARRLSTSFETIQNVSYDFSQKPWRYSLLKWVCGSIIVDSSYNAAPLSMQKTIEHTIKLRNDIYHDYDIIYCLGDMRELWDMSEEEHRKLASLVAPSADVVCVIWTFMSSVFVDELQKIWFNKNNIHAFTDSISLWNFVLSHIEQRQRCSVIFCKWSQNTIFLEETVKILLKNPSQSASLCRQSAWRMKKKRAFFTCLDTD